MLKQKKYLMLAKSNFRFMAEKAKNLIKILRPKCHFEKKSDSKNIVSHIQKFTFTLMKNSLSIELDNLYYNYFQKQ